MRLILLLTSTIGPHACQCGRTRARAPIQYSACPGVQVPLSKMFAMVSIDTLVTHMWSQARSTARQ
eukprot:7735023-Pyramimonas_sp.AAC.1